MVLLEEVVLILGKHFGGKLHKFHFVTLFMNNNSIHGSIEVQDYMVRGKEQKRRGEERVEIQIGVEKLDEGRCWLGRKSDTYNSCDQAGETE